MSSLQTVKPTESTEDLFIQKVRSTIEKHLDDFEFTVGDLCKEIAMSHSQLHRKLFARTGFSTGKFINMIRLEKAKKLLCNTNDKIAYVAYDTGFSDPNYFSRAFKKEFGVTASEHRSNFRRVEKSNVPKIQDVDRISYDFAKS